MAETKTTVTWRTSTGSPSTTQFEDAEARIIDGCLAVTSQNITTLYAPGQWLRAWTEWTEKVDG